MLKLKLNLDPTLQRVALIGFLMMVELILIKLIEILVQNRQPTPIEVELLFAEGLLVLVTYVLAFVKLGET